MSRFRIATLLERIPGGGKTVAVVVLAFVVGLLMRGGDEAPPRKAATSGTAPAGKTQMYTCSMHPQIRLPDPDARCPICGMELIPVRDDAGGGGPRQLSMSEGARELAEIRTTPVERRIVVKEVRLVGKVGYDETGMRTITAWVPGRLDRLYIDYTGVAVRKAAPMVYMYSPELLVAQDALLKAERAYDEMKHSEASARNLEMQAGTVTALAERLRLWGLTDEQVDEIRKRGTASDHMTILSPISGIVIRKEAVEGDYVKTGQKIYSIADLSRVWVYLDAYESDLAWVRYAQEVEFEAEAYPGEAFRGRISFIDPFLDEKTRTVKVRVTVDNADGRLKPGMFVRARIHAKLAEGGGIVEPALAGKWISPVHPEIVMDEPGNCPICGTPLVSAESLGYVGPDARAPLVVPATAPLRTGKRAVVYVKVPDAARPTFDGREIVLGPRTQEYYIVESGLEEGEQVVTHGAFKIDSALQILAKPSMMSPPEDGSEGPEFDAPESFLASLSDVYQAAIRSQRALAADDLAAAKQALAAASEAADTADMSALAGEAHEVWMALRERLIQQARIGAKASALEAARVAFDGLSKALLETVRAFGQATGVDLHEAHCPMAFDGRGASWLADERTILNPYLGSAMPRCGSLEATFPSRGKGPRVGAAFRRELTPFYDALLGTQRALAADDLAQARQYAAAAASALDAVAAEPGPRWLAEVWTGIRGRGTAAAQLVSEAGDLGQARAAFERLSGVALALLRRFGHVRAEPLHEVFCSMALDNRGASWIQEGDEIVNPYMGSKMLECGEVRASFRPSTSATITPAFREGLSGVVRAYLAVGDALAQDDLAKAISQAAAVEDALGSVSAAGLDADTRAGWLRGVGAMRDATSILRKAPDLEAARRPFALLSDTLADLLARSGHAGPDDLVVMHCPMAFSNRGANWVQRGRETRNPYFGASMLRCGDVTRTLPPTPED